MGQDPLFVLICYDEMLCYLHFKYAFRMLVMNNVSQVIMKYNKFIVVFTNITDTSTF